MSEFINTRENRMSFRWQFLATVSAIALLGSACGAGEARAADDDSDHPTLWIELGGQLSRLNDEQAAFLPPVMAERPSILLPSQKFERLPLYSIDETGKVSFEPDNSNWIFSASVRYGHSSSEKHVHQQTSPKVNVFHFTIPTTPPVPVVINQFPIAARFAETSVQNGESHSILDFQAGKDVGLGIFGGSDQSSVFNLGVRFAQFSSNTTIALKSDPDFHRVYRYANLPSYGIYNEKNVIASGYHSNAASLRASRSFHGIGPSLSWNASVPLMDDPQNSELTFDWGLNAAILFGRQRAKVQHQATGQYRPTVKDPDRDVTVTYQPPPIDVTRTKTVTVPNVGGFAGATWRIQNFKVSAGYRADLFFGAMDGGIDARKNENVGFNGPFATISIGFP